MNSPTQAHANRRVPRWILVAWMIIIGLAITKAAPVANATHSDGGSWKRHQALIHYATGDGNSHGANDEDYCVDSHTGSMSWTTARDRVRDTLVLASPRWDGTGNWRLDLWVAGSNCLAYADRNWIELEYRVADSWSQCGANYSCVEHYTSFWDNTYGHTHFTWNNAYLKVSHIWGDTASYRKLINHESGHLFGLLDGAGTCPGSIMHNEWYGCSNWPYWYPSSGDFSSVVAIMNGR